ncbi:MAG TPA: tetratricopeptide repeat protein [Candidatus Gastranaerophilaceae bacterium]|nr:tetratricopeptide repeat protein [Candidatus Gastranaerophilaceae bacterium]
MLEQAIMGSNLSINLQKARESLEIAREHHEKYLVRLNNQDLQFAIEHYITAIKLDPSIPETYYRLASLMWENGQICLNTAIEQCKTAVSIAPNNINAHIYTGYFLKLAHEFNSAENEFKNAIKLGGVNSARPRLILSLALLEKMNTQKTSVREFAKCLYYLTTGTLMMAWDLASLKMLYKNFAEDFSIFSYKNAGEFCEKFNRLNAAAKVYEKGAEITGCEELFYHKTADICVKKREMESAVENYQKVLDANPKNRDVLIKLATIIQTFFPDDSDIAIDCYNKLLEIEEDNAKIYYELGHLYLNKNDKIHALSAFKLALDKDSENPFYNNALAYAFVQAELYDEAIEHYQKAIKLNPDKQWTAIVCQALGAIYYQIKENFEAAVASFQAGIVLDPDNSEIYLSLGDVYMAEDDLDKAIRAYCDSISINPEDYRAYSKAGLALWEKDYLEEAIVAYHRAIDLNPDYDIAHNNLGVIYLDGIGTPDEALTYFQNAIEINPNYTLAYFNAGRALQALAKNNDAADYYQMAMDLNKLTQDIDEEDIKERLYGLFNI